MIDTKAYRVVLSSASPRRQELFKGLDIDFEVEVRPVEETYDSEMTIEEVPVHLAKLKLEPWSEELATNSRLLVVTSDTVVLLDGKIIEKPKSEEDAKRMLRELSGRTHRVITGCALGSSRGARAFSDMTEVTFKELSVDEIDYYIGKYRPFDKAGSYGVQEWLGYVGVNHMNGSYFNVMGLPLHKLYQELMQFDFE